MEQVTLKTDTSLLSNNQVSTSNSRICTVKKYKTIQMINILIKMMLSNFQEFTR